jgi:OmpR family response regulator RpaB
MHQILIIDDDERLAGPLADYLRRYGIALSNALHPDQGLALLREQRFELLILDVMLPDRDGFELCREIRRDNDIPIIMLTARGEVMDRIVGLELGADDYLSKPFEPRELVARIQNILKRRRPTEPKDAILHFEELTIDFARRQVQVQGRTVELTSMEYQLLELFANNPGKNFTRDEILNQIKGIDAEEIYTRSVDILISRLRQKLKPTRYIKTVWGSGYCFIAPHR